MVFLTSIIRTIDGKVLHKYKHPAAVFGCDWSQNNKDMIATGCEDKNHCAIWDYTQDACINVLSGHTAPVRGCCGTQRSPTFLPQVPTLDNNTM
ncbi:WD repeat-containing protein 17 [Merluccius polli]|uniref:WD repeat-containing protein 17 n=1 Tax=Merluccius polli TaxID=89951 RepID=A0AA47LZ78_MERPO|nr:WD repeat-containing protein 17 [Merluccius polli]